MAFDVPDEEPVWVALSAQPDKIMARMVATMMSANGVHARVTEIHGQICVEVQEHDFEHAMSVYDSGNSGITTPLQESNQSTGIHTGARIREQLAARAALRDPEPKPVKTSRVQWMIVLVMIAAGIAFLLWAFAG
ncbi:MAG: hypothetical protein L3J82_06175 [Planctomycetes bacterium]|nr:hypothetical protein [Planctomycetota bacterium]